MALLPSTPAVQALVFPHPKSVADPFVAFIQNKKPCLLFGKQGSENLVLLLPAYLQSIRINCGFTVSFGQTKAKHTTGLTMTCRLRDWHHLPALGQYVHAGLHVRRMTYM